MWLSDGTMRTIAHDARSPVSTGTESPRLAASGWRWGWWDQAAASGAGLFLAPAFAGRTTRCEKNRPLIQGAVVAARLPQGPKRASPGQAQAFRATVFRVFC